MSIYKYKAIKEDGSETVSSIEAQDKTAFFNAVRQKRETIVSFEEVKSKINIIKFILNKISRISLRDKILLAKNLGSMLDSGLSLTRALSIIERQSSNPSMSEAIKNISDNVSKGQTLNQSFGLYPKVFPPLFISMVKVGEESGGLSGSLKILSSQMEKTYILKKKIRGAFMYPAIILSVMVLIGILLFVYVIPTLVTTFKELNAELPTSTKAIIWLSDVLENHFFLAFALVSILIVFAVFLSRTVKGKRFLDFLFLRIPIIGNLMKEVNMARVARTLSSLLSAGVSMVEAINITGSVLQNVYYKEALASLAEQIQKGITVSSVISKYENLFSLFVIEMMNVGEETGKLSSMLLEVADYYENEVDQKTKDMSTIVEPFLMVIIGVVVGFFALSIISPMYSLTDSI